MIARFAGHCPRCDQDYQPGADIEHTDDGWQHKVCRITKTCPSCWEQVASNGTCACNP